MSIFSDLGYALGLRIAKDAVDEKFIERSVKARMAEEWDRLADDPKYASIREKLLKMSADVRKDLRDTYQPDMPI